MVKEISDLLNKLERVGETEFYLGGERKEDIFDKNGNPTGYSICEPKTGRTGYKYLYDKKGNRVGVISGPGNNEIFDQESNRTGFYIENNRIKYNPILDEKDK